MVAKAVLTFLFIILSLVVPPISSGAPPTNLTVHVNGQTIQGTSGCPAPPASEAHVYLSGCLGEEVNYSGFKIAGTPAGSPARVVASEANADSIRIENALITATSACSNSTNGCGDILFSAIFDAPPDGTSAMVTFERPASGNLKRGANPATGDWIKVTGWADGNEIGALQKKTVTCISPATCADFTMSQSEDWYPPSMSGPREIMVQFWFYLKLNGDKLTVMGARGRNPGGAGGGGGGNGPGNKPDITSAADECDMCCKACPPRKSDKFMQFPKTKK